MSSKFRYCLNSIKSRRNKGKLRKKIQRFAKTEFENKFYYLDLSSEIDFGGLSTYLENSLMHEIENYITAPNDNTKKTLVAKACYEAKADNRSKKAVVMAFFESVITIMKQDFIGNVDKSFKVYANVLKDDLFSDVKSEILDSTNTIMGGLATLNAGNDVIISSQAMQIDQLSKLIDDIKSIKSAVIQEQIERNTAFSASMPNPLDLLRDFGVSVSGNNTVASAIKYSSKNEIINIRFCVKREGRIAAFSTTDEYLANLNYTMVEDTVDVVNSVIIQNGNKTEHNFDDNYTGAVCYLPWLSFTDMEIHSSGLDRFTDSQFISSKLTIVPKQIQVTYNIENGDREMLWQGVKYKLHRSVENNNRCCYYENEAGNSIRINIKFTFETILQDEESIVINPQPNISISIIPSDNSNTRSQLEYYQALMKLHSTDTLKFIDVKTMRLDFSCGVRVNNLCEEEIISFIDMYKKIIDIEEYFQTKFKLEFPIDSDLWNHINMIHGLIINKKVTANFSSMSLATQLESSKVDIGCSFGWVAQVKMNKQLFDKELPIENVVMVCPNVKYIRQDDDSAVFEIIDEAIYYWDTEDKVYSNLNAGFNKIREIVGSD